MVAGLKADQVGWYLENDLTAASRLRMALVGHRAKPLREPRLDPPASSHQTGREPTKPAPLGPKAIPVPPGMAASQGQDQGMTMPPSLHGGEMADSPGVATPWAHFFAVIVLGVWLITSPSAFDYRSSGLAETTSRSHEANQPDGYPADTGGLRRR